MQQLSDLDYDAIENAVMETARGRWFLSEYKKRNSGANTSTLLSAISRLEKVVTTLNDGSYAPKPSDQKVEPPVLVEAKTTSTKDQKSAKAFVAPTPFFSGAKKQDATKSEKSAAVSVPEPAALNDENLKFFSNDEDLFSDDANDLLPDATLTDAMSITEVKIEAVPTVKPEAIADDAETKLDKETENVSDRFKVFRTEPKEETEIASTAPEVTETAPEPKLDALFGKMPTNEDIKHDEPAVETAPIAAASTEETASTEVESPVVPDPVMQATDDEKDRIVIIRGNADTGLDIPFGDDIFGDKEDKPTLS